MKKNQALQEAKLAMIRRWEESGLSQKQFCENEPRASNNFHYWLKKYRDLNEEPIDPHQRNPGKFIKLKTETPISSGSVFSEIIFANGNRIKFYNPVDVSQLKQLAV
ncbi:MAG: hypothetical protein H0W75_06705 [Chitinophagaceae bacterium]|nr:hypothetical protein [Chitinophagaceae bacterium]